MKRPDWFVRPAYFKLPSLGWAWLILVALIAAGASWQTRYSPIHVRNQDNFTITYVWDRWRHRSCGHIIGAVGERPRRHNVRLLRCWETDSYDPEWLND
jgi:YD repeat-containing protein